MSSSNPATSVFTGRELVTVVQRLRLELDGSVKATEGLQESEAALLGQLDEFEQQRVQEQLSLRSRMQAARAREEKARQEQMLIEKTLQNALIDEEADQRKLNEYTESLFNRQYQTPTNPLKCNEERADCLSCYEKTSAGGNAPLECAKFIDAFVQCANDVQREFVSRGRPNP